MPNFNPHATLDEQALTASLEGIECPEHYLEIMYSTNNGLLDKFALPLFPAIRILFRSDIFTIARVYIGNREMSSHQDKVLHDAYVADDIEAYAEHMQDGEVIG